MSKDSLKIRRMHRKEMDLAVDWAVFEGWNPGTHDAECFYVADPDGFFIGLLEDKPVAMVSAVAYSESYGFMGFYMVKPEYRTTGFGVKLWEEGMKYLDDRTIGLDSVRPDLVSHKKPEFQPAYINFRYKWIKNGQLDVHDGICDVLQIGWDALYRYDNEVFGFEREGFLKCWISRPETLALALLRNGNVSGYGVIRECRDGFKIGPLFADDFEIAQSLFQALVRDVPDGRNVFLDTPEINPEAVSLAIQLGMIEVFRTTRMYNGQAPAMPLHKWFGITSFELG